MLDVTPVGNPLMVRLTGPENPAIGVIATVYDVDAPWTTVRLAGEVLSEKSGTATTRDAAAVCVRLPLTPVMVSVLEPTGVPDPVVTDSVAAEVAGFGEKLAVVPLGRPPTLSATLPLKPPMAFTVTE